MAKDVLEVLRAMPQTHEERRAIDRVAELIAADVEYDEAHANWVRWGRPGSGKAVAAYKAAEKRRAAALAACRGM